MDSASLAGEVALNIFGGRTITPSPPYRVRGRLSPSPPANRQAGEGRGIYKDKGRNRKNNERPKT